MRRARLEPEPLSAAGPSAAILLGGFMFDAVFFLSEPMAAGSAR
jgi:hypothetical protein